jgi:hypothetical protein
LVFGAEARAGVAVEVLARNLKSVPPSSSKTLMAAQARTGGLTSKKLHS